MTLTEKERTLLRLFTAIVLGEWDEVRRLRAEAGADRPDRAWREAVLQTHLFAGFPRLVQAYGQLAEVGGLGAPGPEELSERPPEARAEDGRELFEHIYGDGADAVRGVLAEGHPHFASMIAEHAYARVLSRPGLAADRRELLAVCALAALRQERQLASHARGALRCGATYAELTGALDEVSDLIDPARLERALRIVERFR